MKDTTTSSHKEILLVSSQFPSGVAWLLNFFLELNIPITANYSEESGMHALWNFDTNHIARLKPEADHLKLWIPALTKYESFSFGRQRPIRWMHSFPHNVRRDQPTILLVRDGRDAVYSQFKRTREAKNLNVWLDRPIEPFALSPPYTWALFQSAWRNAVAPEHLLIVHFEELKQRPHETAEKILQFLQTRRAASLVDAAIAACSIERAQESEAAYRARREHTDEIATVHRKGAVQEWRTTYTPAALEKFTGFPQEVLHEFGYETPKTAETKKIIRAEEAELLAERWGLAASSIKNMNLDPLLLDELARAFLTQKRIDDARHVLQNNGRSFMRFRIRERCHALESTFKRLHTRIKNLPQENIYGHTNRLHWIEAQLRAHLQRTHTAKADLKILYADHNSNNLIRSTLVQKGYCITNKPAEVSEDQFKAILCIDQKILPLVHQLAPNGLLLITLQKNHHSIKDLLNIFADLGLQVNNMQASTLFAGTVANTLIKKFPLLLQANIWAAHHLPLSLASGWFFALEKKS